MWEGDLPIYSRLILPQMRGPTAIRGLGGSSRANPGSLSHPTWARNWTRSLALSRQFLALWLNATASGRVYTTSHLHTFFFPINIF